MRKLRIITGMTILTGIYLIVTDIWKVRKWRKRWGTPIDKGDLPAAIPVDYKTQAAFSEQYQIAREWEL